MLRVVLKSTLLFNINSTWILVELVTYFETNREWYWWYWRVGYQNLRVRYFSKFHLIFDLKYVFRALSHCSLSLPEVARSILACLLNSGGGDPQPPPTCTRTVLEYVRGDTVDKSAKWITAVMTPSWEKGVGRKRHLVKRSPPVAGEVFFRAVTVLDSIFSCLLSSSKCSRGYTW